MSGGMGVQGVCEGGGVQKRVLCVGVVQGCVSSRGCVSRGVSRGVFPVGHVCPWGCIVPPDPEAEPPSPDLEANTSPGPRRRHPPLRNRCKNITLR